MKTVLAIAALIWLTLVVIMHYFSQGQMEFMDPDITISIILLLRVLLIAMAATLTVQVVKKICKRSKAV